MKILLAGLLCFPALFAQTGIVRSAGQLIPGVSVTASQGDRKLTTVTDENGQYAFEGMTAGTWDLEVSIFGFVRTKQSVTIGTVPIHTEWTIELAAFPGPGRGTGGGGMGRVGAGGGANGNAPGAGAGAGARAAGDAGGAARGGAAAGQRGFQQVQNVAEGEVTAELARASVQETPLPTGTEDSTESFLLNGTLSRGLQVVENNPEGQGFGPGGFRPGMEGEPGQQPGGFGQGGPGGPGGGMAGGGGGGFGGRGGGGVGRGGGGFGTGGGFGGRGGPGGPNARGPRGTDNGQFLGNRARRGQNQIRGALVFSLRNSALDAAPYSVNGQTVDKPSYAQSRFGFMIGGPLAIPKILNSPNTFFFINYNGARARNPYRGVGTVPTLDERSGDFTARATTLYDPTTALPYAGNQIPLTRISPISLGLLKFIPLPNQPGLVQNYVFVGSSASDTDNLNLRLNQNLGKKDRLAITINTQRRDGNSLQMFGFRDENSGSGWNSNLNWAHTLAPRSINNLHWAFNRSVNNTIPFFAYSADIAGQLGIVGSSRDPINFGPPNLSFTNYAGLSDATPNLVHNQTSTLGDGMTWSRGKHNMSFGFEYRRIQLNNRTDQNARGSFTFSGLRTSGLDANTSPLPQTGYDFADFLLGLPQSSSIRFGDTSTYFRGNVYSAYSQDDWRITSNFSLMLGLRYEYFTPMQEKYGHIANLAIAPGFTGVTVVTPDTAGQPAALVKPDRNNFSPRLGFAWKPSPKGKTQVRGGYGIYYNSSIYNQIANRMAAQPPFANTSSVSTSLDTPLTLAQGLTQIPVGKTVLNTYAVDPDYKLAYAQTWTTSIQQELPRNLVAEIGYIGTKGTRLDIQRQPNRAAPGSPLTAEQRRQIGNAVGFTYESAEGDSIYHALQLRLMRRFRRGLSGNFLYTFGKSIDNSSTFGGAGNSVAQNDKDLRAERGLSSFDQRHTVRGNFVWNSPIGTRSADTWYNRLAKDWTFNGGVTYSSGMPLTARVLGNLADSSGTGAAGSGRADASGLSIDGGPYFNLAAFAIPPSGRFGNAGRNTIPGPATFSTNASFGRSFRLAERRAVEFRLESTNITNHVTITSVGTTVNALTYGLPLAAGGMRTVSANVRFRF